MSDQHDHQHDDHAHKDHGHSDSTHAHDDMGRFDEHGEDFLLDEDSEILPIEPAGIVNDLSYSENFSPVDLREHFYFQDAFAVSNNPHNVWNDVTSSTAGLRPRIDLSQKLTLKIPSSFSRETLDVYASSTYTPSFTATFSKNPITPRTKTIVLVKDLPFMGENTADIRTSEEIPPTKLHPDIYLLDATIARRARHIRRKHGKKIVRGLLYIGAGSLVACVGLFILAGLVEKETTEAYKKLASLTSIKDPALISVELESIDDLFSSAKINFAPIQLIINSGFIRSDSAVLASRAIHGGASLSEGLMIINKLRNELAVGVKPTRTNQSSTGTLELTYFDPRILTNNTVALTEFLKENRESIKNIQKYLELAQFEFSSIESTGDVLRDNELRRATEILSSLEKTFAFILKNQDQIADILGDKQPKHYLVLNQNRDELRANGGFPGSAIELTFYKGRLDAYEKKDIYFYDWNLFPYGEIPPPGIDKITSVFGMRDANYYPDFADTFATINRMYEKAGGSTLDGIVAINQGLVTDILRTTGPLTVPGIREEISADNFSLLLSVLVEGQIGRKSTAKDVLFTTIESLEKKMLEVGKFDLYQAVLAKHVQEGQVLVALRDQGLENFVHKYIPGPTYQNKETNFVYPLFTSISGNKSDRYVKRGFTIETQSLVDCKIKNTFTLTNNHEFSIEEREKIRRMLYSYGVDPKEHEHELFVQGNGANVQFVRVLTPKDSTILEDGNVEVTVDDSQADYTEFNFYIKTNVGENSNANFTYVSTPKNCSSTADFIVQPGLQNFTINTR